jgi:D-alanine-D-alanine ligase
VYEALDAKRYDVVLIGITRRGRWVTGSAAELLSGKRLPERDSKLLVPDPTVRGLVPVSGSSTSSKPIDVVFPILHGTYGEDGTIQGLFELANIPFVGSGVLGSAVGMDKVVQKQLFAQAGLPVVPYEWFYEHDWNRQSGVIMKRLAKKLRAPYFVKPANAGSSIGITKAVDSASLRKAIQFALRYDEKVLVESGVPKAREFDCAILGNDAPRASGIAEIVPDGDFYDYNAKYAESRTEIIVPADVSVRMSKTMQALSVKAFSVVNASGLARVEFLYGAGKLYLSEINTLPGFTSHSIYPRLWAAQGLTYANLIDELLRLAIERQKNRSKKTTDYAPSTDWFLSS